jgi:hypothetical protein
MLKNYDIMTGEGIIAHETLTNQNPPSPPIQQFAHRTDKHKSINGQGQIRSDSGDQPCKELGYL